jgi:hypothetical protein
MEKTTEEDGVNTLGQLEQRAGKGFRNINLYIHRIPPYMLGP